MNDDPILMTPVLTRPVFDVYQELKELGRGAFGRVVLGQHKQSGALRALKIFPKEAKMLPKVMHEKELMRRSIHSHILTVHEVIEDEDGVTLALEYIQHGDLLHWMKHKGSVSELEVCIIVHQVLGALEYLHARDIVHRDVKPNNILVRETSPIQIALCDFGLSKLCVCEQGLYTPAGPGLNFTAPDILRALQTGLDGGPLMATRNEAKGWEVWSVGVLTYFLLSGSIPFKGGTVGAQLDVMDSGTLRFPPALFGEVSDNAKDFVRALLTPDVSARIRSAAAARMHVWFELLREECVTPEGEKASSTLLATPGVLANITRDDVKKVFADCAPPSVDDVAVKDPHEYVGAVRVVGAAKPPRPKMTMNVMEKKKAKLEAARETAQVSKPAEVD